MKRARTFAGLLLSAALMAAPCRGEDAVLTSDGILFEVFLTTWGEVDASAPKDSASLPVLALRSTAPDGTSAVEVVGGTLDGQQKSAGSIEYEPITKTVFVAYTKSQGVMTDLHLAVRRGTRWQEQAILPSPGLYFSVNPKIVTTRQKYVDVDATLKPLNKERSVLSLVWWEEGGSSQARYAAAFVEDGVLRLDPIPAYDLNELAKTSGPTDAGGLPPSSYAFPALQRDPASNGSVLVSFANLATRKQTTLRISFPDDVMKLLAEEVSVSGTNVAIAQARAHVPVGREVGSGNIPQLVDTLSDVGACISSSSGVTNFYWLEGASLHYTGSDAAADEKPRSILLRKDLSLDKAVNVIREMTARQ